jgi:hypothetical protein
MRTLRATLLGLLLAGCAAPVPSATPTGSAVPSILPSSTLAPPSPTSSNAFVFTCYHDPVPTPSNGPGSPSTIPSSYCPAELVAVEAAISKLVRPTSRIAIEALGFPCGSAFDGGSNGNGGGCFLHPPGPVAYVSFVGTDNVAALSLALVPNGPLVATLVTYEVPPPGWSMP